MTLDKLDQHLRTHNQRELEYLSGDFKPAAYSNSDGWKIPVQTAILPNEIISVLRHNRYRGASTHTHEYIEMLYVYSGSCVQHLRGKTFTLTKGNILIIDTNMPHSIDPIGENDIIVNLLMRKEFFSVSLLSRLSSEGIISQFLVDVISATNNHENYLLFQPADSQKIDYSMKQLLCEYYDRSLCSDEIINCHLLLTFSELLREARYAYYKSAESGDAQKNLIYILQYIEKNYLTCTLESVAKWFGFHPNYLSSFIKKMTGQTFKSLILKQKMLHASHLLRNTTTPVYTIAELVGYNNLSFFYKKFQEHFNLRPQEYREKFLFRE
jgi:AraC-like DNA-binding protein